MNTTFLKCLCRSLAVAKKYLDKIRQEGLDLRKRLEEEKQPSMQEQQPMAEAQPAPAPAQAAPAPQAPMMQQGGFVDDPQKKTNAD